MSLSAFLDDVRTGNAAVRPCEMKGCVQTKGERVISDLFAFLCIFLEIRNSRLHFLSPDIKTDNEGCGCGKEEQQSLEEIFHYDLPLNYYLKRIKKSTHKESCLKISISAMSFLTERILL